MRKNTEENRKTRKVEILAVSYRIRVCGDANVFVEYSAT